MTPRAQGLVCWIVGLGVAAATLRDIHLWLVKPAMTWPLLTSAAVLAVVGGRLLLTGGGSAPAASSSTGHAGHAHGPSRVGWVFVVPFLLLPFAISGPLGAASAANAPGVVVRTERVEFEPLPPDPVVALPVAEFWDRAAYDSENTLAGRRVRLVGFATPSETEPGWVLTRYVIMCCAADASALMVEPVGATPVEADTWVAVEGEWLPSGASIDDRPSEMPRLRVTSLEPAERPREPYESAADVPRG